MFQTVADMEELDRQRREEFKEYEMKKKADADHRMVIFFPLFSHNFILLFIFYSILEHFIICRQICRPKNGRNMSKI